jgi:hypothetical protein
MYPWKKLIVKNIPYLQFSFVQLPCKKNLQIFEGGLTILEDFCIPIIGGFAISFGFTSMSPVVSCENLQFCPFLQVPF